MPQTAQTSLISPAVQAIQTASKKVKLTTELEDSLEQLNSIVKLLEFSKLWPSAFQRLTSLLRQHLLPLYETFPILGMRFSVAVLVTIYETKILLAAESDEKTNKASWEVVQAALLSGILDFLEANPSSENRAIVATAFYPTLRLVFFPRPFPLPGPNLMYILYQLLSETVTSHPVNQAQLRNQETLGGIQVGAILSQTKNFLVIEALLELFVKLLPAKTSNDGIKARTRFIHDVFDPAKFACTAAIADVFESPPTADWEGIFLKLIDLLASTDAAFPQPFQISNFRIQGSKAYHTERIYVDDQGFVANIDEGDQIETFHAMYTSVQSVKVAAPYRSKASVTIVVFPPPSVGQATVTKASEGNVIILFDIRGKEVASFLQSLKTRGLKNIDQTARKLSTAEKTLTLDYDSTRKTVTVSTQDKVRDLARLWDFSNSQSHSGQVVPTSPLLPHRSPSHCALARNAPAHANCSITEGLQKSITPTKTSKPHVSSPYYDSICGTTDEELTDLSDADEAKAETSCHSGRLSGNKRLRPMVDAYIGVESEDETSTVRRIKKRNNKIILSDEEMDDLRSPSIQIPQRLRARGNGVSTGHPTSPDQIGARAVHPKPALNSSALALASNQKNIALSKNVNPATNNVDDLDRVPGSNDLCHDKKTAGSSITPQLPATTSAKGMLKQIDRKRKAAEASNAECSDSQTQRLPRKRPREGPVVEMEVKSVSKTLSPKPLPRKRYGKKGRTSSPSLPSILDVDFDKLPTPSDAPCHKPEDKQSSRVSAMKDKGGKTVLKKPKRETRQPKNPKGVATVETSRTGPRKRAKVQPNVTTKISAVESNELLFNKLITKDKKTTLKTVLEPQRRSARVAGIPAKNTLVVQEAPEQDNDREVVSAARSAEHQFQSQPDDGGGGVCYTDGAKQEKPPDAPANDFDLMKPVATPTGATTGPVNLAFQTVSEEDIHEPLFVGGTIPSTDPVAEETAEQKIIEDYFMPLKTVSESTSFEVGAEKDGIMIDLTQESPESLPTVVAQPVSKSKSPMIRPIVKDVAETSRQATTTLALGRLPVWGLPSPNPDHARVSFAPSASIRPYRVFDFGLECASEPEPEPKENRDSGSSSSYRYSYSKHHEKQTSKNARDYQGYPKRKRDVDPMPRIIDVISEITQVVVQNTSRRFDQVGKDLRAGQRSILLETACDLEVILAESIQHHTNFVSLESEYAAHHRKIIDALEGASKIEQELLVLLAGIIQEHNRSSLSRKFSNTFFSSPLPSIISNKNLVL